MAGKNAFYAQSGGVTAVISASACGLLQTARQHSDEIGKVYLLTRAAEEETRRQYPCSPPVPWNGGFEN